MKKLLYIRPLFMVAFLLTMLTVPLMAEATDCRHYPDRPECRAEPPAQPSTPTGTSTATSGSSAASEAGAQAAANLNAAIAAMGGNATGGTATVEAALRAAQTAYQGIDLAVRDSFNTSFQNALNPSARASMNGNVLQGGTLNLAGARLGGDSSAQVTTGSVANQAGGGGGANVSTNVLNIALPTINAQAPGLPAQIGPFLVLVNPCDYALTYRLWVQPTVYRNTFLPDTIVAEETALYTIETHVSGDRKGQPIQADLYKVLLRAKDGKSRIVECEFSRQVIAMEHTAGSNGFSASLGTRDGAAGIGGSSGATRSFPTAKYLLPVKGKIRQCLVEGDWVNEELVGPQCGNEAQKSGQVPVATTPASTGELDALRAKLTAFEAELAKRPVLTVSGARTVTGFAPTIVDDKPTGKCGGKPLPPGKRCAYVAEYGDRLKALRGKGVDVK